LQGIEAGILLNKERLNKFGFFSTPNGQYYIRQSTLWSGNKHQQNKMYINLTTLEQTMKAFTAGQN